MDADFWLEKWQSNQLGFHLDEVNPLLTKYFSRLSLQPNGRVFLPLCGKTLDVGWLLGQGYRVTGCELSELAVAALFRDLGLDPDITKIPNGLHYAAPDIDVFVCDIFSLSSELLGHIDAIYDRAALVALPTKTRRQYPTQHNSCLLLSTTIRTR
jgi:thiopurine S-methyltransferase